MYKSTLSFFTDLNEKYILSNNLTSLSELHSLKKYHK